MIVILPSRTPSARASRSMRRRRRGHGMFSPRAERLEGRALLATFPVTTLLDGGAGSLRDAIVQANTNPGADDITFSVAGTINLRSALPVIVDPVTIAGGTAPGFVSSPVVTVNFAGRSGLRFAAGSDDSSLQSLSLIRAAGAGVTIDASDVTLTGNFVGVLPDGTTAAGNRGEGVRVNADSTGVVIGTQTEVTSAFTPSVTGSGGTTLPVYGWQGLTTAGTPGQFLFTGTTPNPSVSGQTAGLLYQGPITTQGGMGYVMVMPDQLGQTTDGTSAYSADNLGNGRMRIVGTYSIAGRSNELGFLFTGTVNDLATPGNYERIPLLPSSTWNVPHSTSGGLVVGNYDTSSIDDVPQDAGRAYVYDAVNRRYLVQDMVYPGSKANTAYGIWWNGGTSYTICGGWSESEVNNLLDPNQPMPLSKALLVDYDSSTNRFSNWKSFSYTPPSGGATVITHFEGISGVEPGKYTLAATALDGGVTIGGFATVYRNADGSFSDMEWTDIPSPSSGVAAFADSIYGNAVVGIDPSSGSAGAYQATVVTGGNVISGNGGHGVRLFGSTSVVGFNRIGTTVAGTAALANGGDGVRIEAGAERNLVGHEDPVTDIEYFGAGSVPLPVQSWTGIRGLADGQYLITGSTSSNGVSSGLLYVGPLSGASAGAAYAINYPGGTGTTTSVYGPDDLGNGNVLLVGTYVLPNDSTRYGFSFRGNLATMATDVTNPANYTTISNGSSFNYLHSAMGGLVVGNFIATTSETETGRAFIYDLDSQLFTPIVFPGSISNTAYGIWDNGDGTYTIAGGFSQVPVNNATDRLRPLGMASLIDYDRASGRFSNPRAFSYEGLPDQATAGTHFMGISGVEDGVYTLSGSAYVSGQIVNSGLATVRRQADGSFGPMTWQELSPPVSVTGVNGLPSANSVYGNAVVGIVLGSSGAAGYQARVDVGFQPSNVISGNRGSGVTVAGGVDNAIAMNLIGTNPAGTAAVSNRGNGILVTSRANRTLIGGQATGGNDPTAGVFVRPPQGNLISGNDGNGVLVTGAATATTISGNFVGTDATGNAALGNVGDGVAVVNASGTSLVGTTFRQSPFVFYNVLSGNGGNGLRITNATDTTVQANFAGVGANNATVVANGGSGILANGTSSSILAGGPIPLGNVTSGNDRHGIEVSGRTSGFVSYNNFAGMFAFGGAAPNRLDGMNITATGGGTIVRTSLVGGNLGNGIVLAGNATGVTIEDTAAGTNFAISAALPNGGSGVLITGNARGNAIGGFQPSIETKVHLSGNGRYGIEVTGRARDNQIFNAVIGAGFVVSQQIPNALGGVFIGPGTSGTVLGGSQPFLGNRVLFNAGVGVTVSNASRNQIIGNEIRANAAQGIALLGGQNNVVGAVGAGNNIVGNALNGVLAAGNLRGSSLSSNTISASGSNGLLLQAATNLLVGGVLDGVANTIVTSTGYGLSAIGACGGTRVIRNVIRNNVQGNVDLSQSTGIIYVP